LVIAIKVRLVLVTFYLKNSLKTDRTFLSKKRRFIIKRRFYVYTHQKVQWIFMMFY